LWASALFDALNRCTPKQADKRRAVLPYLLQTMDAEPEWAVVLNRDYKPVGVTRRDYVRYEEYPEAHIHVELYRLLEPRPNIYSYYFFNDANPPWDSPGCLQKYREKIKDLLSPWIDTGVWS
jgi:hypothetical protein